MTNMQYSLDVSLSYEPKQ